MPQSFRHLVGAPPSTASPTDSALLIIDAQQEYASGLLAVVDHPSSLRAITGLLGRYRAAAAAGLVVHILHETSAEAPVFTVGKEVGEPMGGVEPRAGEKVIKKHHPGAFTGTGLHEFLQEKGKKKVVLCGYMAHVCVSTTARQAAELGYEVILARDAIGDRDIPGVSGEEVTKIALLELEDAFGTVLDSRDIK